MCTFAKKKYCEYETYWTGAQIYRNVEDSHWVGKASLRGWRKLAAQQIEQAEKIAEDHGATPGNYLVYYNDARLHVYTYAFSIGYPINDHP